MTSKPRMTKAEARRARLAEAQAVTARAQRRRRRRLAGSIGGAAVVVVALIVWAIVSLGGSARKPSPAAAGSSTPSPSSTTVAAGRTNAPPWAAPQDPSAAVAAAGLPMLGSEGNEVHIHVHLDVIASGRPVTMPADIGIDRTTQKISPLHTHDTTGVIHVESPTKATFTLGQLFTEWRVALSANRIGGLVAAGDNQLHAYVNGKLVPGDPATITLAAHDEIALVYGTAAQQTDFPSSYAFPAGE
jgi:hypothetical protein